MRFREFAETITYREQLGGDDPGPIRLVNVFTMAGRDVGEFLRVWAADAAFMKRQPGFVSTQLLRGSAGSPTFVNVAVWESVGDLRTAFSSPGFQDALGGYPDSVVAMPHVFQTVAVPGICVA